MADIFISYSKPDRLAVEDLAAYLEAEGWSVWWDSSLAPGDRYRDEIMRQLAKARAVIVVWTPASVKSDWVRAEAGRAKADRKLIPVKTSDVSYRDIPLPFGEMHTESLERRDLIRATVLAALIEPKVQPSILCMAVAGLRLHLIKWLFIVGAAINAFAGLKASIAMSDWARWLVTNWSDLTHAFWTWSLHWLNIKVSPLVTPSLTLAVFLVVTAIGSKLQHAASVAPPKPEIPIPVAIPLLLLSLGVLAPTGGPLIGKPQEFYLLFKAASAFSSMGFAILLIAYPAFRLYKTARNNPTAAAKVSKPLPLLAEIFKPLLVFLLTCFIGAITAATPTFYRAMDLMKEFILQHPEWSFEQGKLYVGEFLRDQDWYIPLTFGAAYFGTAFCLMLAPANYLIQRFTFIIIGILILLGFNELSKLNLH